MILFLFIELSVLHLGVSDVGYEECTRAETSNDQIFLVKEDIRTLYDVDYLYQHDLNFEFKVFCREYYNITSVPLEEAKKYKNVIHFAVPGYYDGKPLGNFVYAGNVSKIDDTVCTKTDKVEPEFDCREIVNLVSHGVKELNDGHVYDIVQEMHLTYRDYDFRIRHRKSCEPPFQKTKDLTTVLLCVSDNIEKVHFNIKPLKLIQLWVHECPYYITKPEWLIRHWNLNRVLAVLAPEPFELPSEYSVPTIFYKTPYMYSENSSAFPNSVHLAPWRLLKYGFLKFIQTVGWQRVAIVTDDSEYSIEFEDELTALFSKERLVYTVIRCEDANCEIKKIAEELDRVSARIVIANVEEKKVQELFQYDSHRITWLLRGEVGKETAKYLLEDSPDAFSVSLYNTKSKICPGAVDSIMTGLRRIAQAYQNIPSEDYNVTKREFYRRFGEKVKDLSPRITEATVVVNRLRDSERILSMSVNEREAQILDRFDPNFFGSGKPTDGTAHCLVTTQDYHNPCGNYLVMLLTFTVIVFVVTFLLIRCYYAKTSPLNDTNHQSDTNYQNDTNYLNDTNFQNDTNYQNV